MRGPRHALTQQLGDDLTSHIGQAEVSTLVPESQLLVGDPETVQQRGLEIVDVHGNLGRVITEFIRVPHNRATLDLSLIHI